MADTAFQCQGSVLSEEIIYAYSALFYEVKLHALFSGVLCHVHNASTSFKVWLDFAAFGKQADFKKEGCPSLDIVIWFIYYREERFYLEFYGLLEVDIYFR